MSSWAERQQPVVTVLDLWMLQRARRTRPTVAWWWGRSPDGASHRLRCHVCGTWLTESAAAHQLPRAAVEAVMEHREAHYRGHVLPLVDRPQEVIS